MKLNKLMVMVFALFVALFSVPFVAADDASYEIVKVKVNGLEVNGDQTSVDIGETVDVDVILKAADNLTESKEVKVKAWLGGYEYGDVEDSSDLFTLNPGVVYSKSLELELPSDMEPGVYALRVRVFDQSESVMEDYTLYVERERHLVDLVDYNVYPSNPEAGDVIEITARLDNDGAKDEDVKLIVEIPGLDVQQKTWIDVASGDEETTDEIEFRLPENVQSGEYELIFRAYYSNGYKFVEKMSILDIRGTEEADVVEEDEQDDNVVIEEPEPVEKELLISLDSTSKTVSSEKESMYKVSLASFDSKNRAITLKVSGAQLFADVRVDPSFLKLEGGQKADAFVFVQMHEDADLGPHTMMLQILEDNKLLKEIQLTAIAEEEEESSALGLDDSTLKIAFVVLVVILIIIGLLIAFRRVRHDEFPLEPHDERTYY